MGKMTSRERVRKTLNKKEPDRVPISLGECVSTTMTVGAHEKLKSYLGIETETNLMSKFFQIVFVDESVLKHFEVDFRPVIGRGPKKSKERRIDSRTFIDEWGVTGYMPPEGFYYDIIDFPLREATIEDIDKHNWPDPFDEGLTEGIEEEARDLYENTDYAIVGSAGLGQSIFEQSLYLRGFDTLLMDLVADKEFAHALFRKVTDIQKTKYDRFLEKTGKYIDIVRIGDDTGMQDGALMSPDMYREMLKPYHQEYFSFIKERTDAKLFLHSCGSVYDLIPDLIDAGVEILNPVQVSAKKMDCVKLKREFGESLIFWGAIDTQRVLPFESPETVKEEVKKRINQLGSNGGFIPSAVHNIQHDVSPQNIIALYEAIREYGTYPLKG